MDSAPRGVPLTWFGFGVSIAGKLFRNPWDVTQYPVAAGPTIDGPTTGNISGVSALTAPKGKEVLTVTLNGNPFTVTYYWGSYANKPNSANQIINIYVPQNATANSATYFRTNNGGWATDGNRATVIGGQTYTTGNLAYNTTQSGSANSTNVIAEVLNRGMILVSYGARSRTDAATNGQYPGHSPGTMTDTKAAIRFLKYNMVKGSLLGDPSPHYPHRPQRRRRFDHDRGVQR